MASNTNTKRHRGTHDFDTLSLGGTAVTSTAAELNILDGVTSTAAELNKLDGVGATATELDQVSDVSAYGVTRILKISVAAGTDSGSEIDTTTDLPASSIVLDCWVDVTTAETTATDKTFDIGLLSSESGGDADGFANGISAAATGIVRPQATVTAGGSETYFASTTRGALLATFLAGADSATDVGTNYEKPHLADSVTAKSISHTSAENFTEAAYDIYFLIAEF